MAFSWTDQSIKWFKDASEYSGFHEEVGELIRPFLSENDTLMDIGCGLGYLDMALAKYVSNIKVVDIDKNVINHVKKRCKEHRINNIQALCGNVNENMENRDVILMSFFGRDGQMERALPYCNKRLIRIVNESNAGNLYPSRYRKHTKSTIPIVEDILDENGLIYKKIQASIEFGQPLSSVSEAREFILYHAPEATNKEVNDFLDNNSIETNNRDLPIYIPNKKNIGIFVVDKFKEMGNK